MEAAPKLEMLPFDVITPPDKEKRYADLAGAVERFILARHQDDPGNYANEVRQLRELQRQAYLVPRSAQGLETLKRYLGQLKMLQARFPLGASTTDAACDNLEFTWYDAFSGKKITSSDIRLEEACIMHNIAALHSYLGADSARSSAEQMKQSCSHFQFAAWAFEQVKSMYSPIGSADEPCIPSLSKEYLNYARVLMLAQAQECILEKSLLDSRKPMTIAKVAAQVVQYYRETEHISVEQCSNLRTSPAGADVFADLVSMNDYNPTKYLQFKQLYYNAIMYYACGCHADDAQKMGERVAYFAEAQQQLDAATKTLQKTEEATRCVEAVQFVGDVIGTKLQAAKKDNDFIYHEKVPKISALKPIECANLVKPMPFDVTDLSTNTTNVDIFHALIPMPVYEQLSVYSERKMDKFRRMLAKSESKNDALAEFMSSIDVESLKILRKTTADGKNEQYQSSLPQEVLDACAEISGAPKSGVELSELLAELVGVSNQLAQHLAVTRGVIIERGSKAEQELAAIAATTRRRPPELQIIKLLPMLEQYERAHEQARLSNIEADRVLNEHVGDWKLLAGHVDQVARQVPKISLMDAPNADEHLRQLDVLIGKVHEMKRQRDEFLEQLRSAMDADDIRQAIMLAMSPSGKSVAGGDFEAVFERELKKFQPTIELLEQNLRAQETIIDALVDADAKCADLRQYVVETMGSRDKKIQQLLGSASLFNATVDKVENGIKFYQDFQKRITVLEEQVRQKLKDFEAFKAAVAADVEAGKNSAAMPPAPISTIRPNSMSNNQPPVTSSNNNNNPSTTGMTLGDYMKHMKLSNNANTVSSNAVIRPQQNYYNANHQHMDAEAASTQAALHALPAASSNNTATGFNNPYQQFQPRSTTPSTTRQNFYAEPQQQQFGALPVGNFSATQNFRPVQPINNTFVNIRQPTNQFNMAPPAPPPPPSHQQPNEFYAVNSFRNNIDGNIARLPVRPHIMPTQLNPSSYNNMPPEQQINGHADERNRPSLDRGGFYHPANNNIYSQPMPQTTSNQVYSSNAAVTVSSGNNNVKPAGMLPSSNNNSSRYSSILSNPAVPPVADASSRINKPSSQHAARMTASYSSLINSNDSNNTVNGRYSDPTARGGLVSSYAQLLGGNNNIAENTSNGTTYYGQKTSSYLAESTVGGAHKSDYYNNPSTQYQEQHYAPVPVAAASQISNGQAKSVVPDNINVPPASNINIPAVKKLLPSSDLDALMGWSPMTVPDNSGSCKEAGKSSSSADNNTKHMVDLRAMPFAPPDPDSLL